MERPSHPEYLAEFQPKGPFRTKNSTESKFTTARKKRYGNSKTLRIVPRVLLVFLGKRGRKTVRIVKNYGGSKILRTTKFRAEVTLSRFSCPLAPSQIRTCLTSPFLNPIMGFLDAAFLLTVGSFLLTVELFDLQLTSLAFFTYNWSFFAYSFSFLLTVGAFFAYSGKVRLIRALWDCKQRSLVVSKKKLQL